MLDISVLNKYDPSGMHKIYDMWPKFAKESFESELDMINFDNIEHIVFVGMGGSGTISDVLSSILSKTNMHVNIIKGFELPKSVNSKTLIVANSASGNTIETNYALKSAKNIGCQLLAFSNGGIMETFCKQNKINFIKTNLIHSPRSSFPIMLFSMIKVLLPILPLTINEIYNTIKLLEKLKHNISTSNLNQNNNALNLASWIREIPIIYHPYGLKAAATRFKNSIHENAKLHCMIEDIIEASHNNIVSWERNSNVQPIILRGDNDHQRTIERWNILKEFFDKKNIEYKEIYSEGTNILEKLVYLIYLLDFTTIYLAINLKTDPTPIKSLDYIKSKVSLFPL